MAAKKTDWLYTEDGFKIGKREEMRLVRLHSPAPNPEDFDRYEAYLQDLKSARNLANSRLKALGKFVDRRFKQTDDPVEAARVRKRREENRRLRAGILKKPDEYLNRTRFERRRAERLARLKQQIDPNDSEAVAQRKRDKDAEYRFQKKRLKEKGLFFDKRLRGNKTRGLREKTRLPAIGIGSRVAAHAREF